jgi:glycerophosphoryl diester phosphodiesterase
MSRRTRLVGALVALAGTAVIVYLAWDVLVLFAPLPLAERSQPPMLIVAHRGNMEALPEDTAEAIWDAASLGADGIEFDVHKSADGTWWVMHDATVDRTTNGTGMIRDLADEELDRLRIDAGPGFAANAGPVIKPPRLADVLSGLGDYNGALFIDLQHATGAGAGDLVRELQAGAPPGAHVTVICRSEEDVDAVHATGSGIAAIIRPNRVEGRTDADGFLLDSLRDVSMDEIAALSRPAFTFNDEGFAYLGEDRLLRRAWSANVEGFLAKDLVAAMKLRDELQRGDR